MKLTRTTIIDGRRIISEFDTTEMYRDFVNNFLTLKAFSEHYGFSENFLSNIIKAERMLDHARYDFKKELEVKI
jgi:hypothetical protein